MEGTGPGELPEGYKPLFQSIEGLFNQAEFSDLSVKCGSYTFSVHKAIVCTRSDYFKRVVTGEFREAKENLITFEEDDPLVVAEMLRYLYTADYKDQSPEDADEPARDPQVFNVRVHTMADEYNIAGLGELAAAKFKKRAENEWCTSGFAEAIREIYTVGPDTKQELQDVVLGLSVKHANELYSEPRYAKFREVAEETPVFTSRFASQLVQKKYEKPGEKRYRCTACARECVFTLLGHTNSMCCPFCRTVWYHPGLLEVKHV